MLKHNLLPFCVDAMANRDNHYEVAFEEYLRSRGVPYVAVDEARRAVLADGGSIKSLDFIVSAPGTTTWLVDVKGRRFPSGEEPGGRQYWKNWSTQDDLKSMAQWEGLFGVGFCAIFVFAYNIVGDRAPLPPEQLFEFRGSLYGFVADSACGVCGAGPSDLAALGYGGDAEPTNFAGWHARWTNC